MYWMDASDASYYINKKITEIKVPVWGTKIFKKTFKTITQNQPEGCLLIIRGANVEKGLRLQVAEVNPYLKNLIIIIITIIGRLRGLV